MNRASIREDAALHRGKGTIKRRHYPYLLPRLSTALYILWEVCAKNAYSLDIKYMLTFISL